MSGMISDKWMKCFSTVWDADSGNTSVPGNIGFKPIIGCGFDGEDSSFGLAHISKKLQIFVDGSCAMKKYSRTHFPFTNEFVVTGKA